jgi:DeoR family transcriptional regulator, aga operon transcriptional repressor
MIVMIKREKEILDFLYQYGELTIYELSDLLGASEPSIRRDLVALNSNRFIERTRGGVRLATAVNYDASPVYRLPVHPKEVLTIAYCAARLVQPGNVVGLSGGKLCTQLALNLRHHEGLTVVTNAVNIAVELACLPDLQVVMTRGQLNPGSFELVGAALEASLNGLHIDQYFQGTDGISLEYGITGHNEPEAAASMAFMKASDATVVLADSIKFKKVSFAQVAPLSAIQTVVTTEEAPGDSIAQLRQAGINILVAA